MKNIKLLTNKLCAKFICKNLFGKRSNIYYKCEFIQKIRETFTVHAWNILEDVLLWFEMPGPGSGGPGLRPPLPGGRGGGGGGHHLALVLVARRVRAAGAGAHSAVMQEKNIY